MEKSIELNNRHKSPQRPIDIFDDENVLGPEIGPADAMTNAIVIGCFMMFLLLALFGFGCILWMAFFK